jgi:UDP-N-acetylglucosamine 4,6-dehydratase/5-epimerase
MKDTTVLITGGTGSFGSTMVDHLLPGGCREIRVLSRDEEKQEMMRSRLKDERVKFYIGDVRDRDSVDGAMQGVDLVFHAAALKQVPSCEFFPIEAVRTNIGGSSNVIESAIAHGVRTVVCLGTDKAVYPVNTMGMTKAVMEKVMQAAARRLVGADTVVCGVRYGNVMYSRGSVIPLFVRQINAAQALTITDPGMTRFMLPLRDAVDLVEFAFRNARQGDIFIRKAPACTIDDLVTALCNLFGVQPERRLIGIRHGEKIYETLATAEELRRAEDLGEYFRVPMDDRDLNYSKYFTQGECPNPALRDYDSHSVQRLTVPQIEQLLLSLPEIKRELPHGPRR